MIPVSSVRWLCRSSDSRSRSTSRESATVAAPRSSSIESRTVGARVGHEHEPPPVLTAGPDRGQQPAAAGVVTGALADAHRSAAVLPAVEDGRQVLARGVDGEHLVREVLQHDRPPGHPGDLTDDLGRGSPLDGELGERGVHLVRGAQLGELGVDDPRVHGLGDRGEAHLVGQLDERRGPCSSAVSTMASGSRSNRRPTSTSTPGDPGRGEAAHVVGEPGVVGREQHAGGEEQLAALEQAGDVGHLRRVGPAHRPVERPGRRRAPPARPSRTAGRSRTSRTLG